MLIATIPPGRVSEHISHPAFNDLHSVEADGDGAADGALRATANPMLTARAGGGAPRAAPLPADVHPSHWAAADGAHAAATSLAADGTAIRSGDLLLDAPWWSGLAAH